VYSYRSMDNSSSYHAFTYGDGRDSGVCLAAASCMHLMPPVVMEFPGITVGGGFAGTGAETSSFRHGLFEQTVTVIDIVLANGEAVHASRSEREDLFYGSGSSFGTTGVITNTAC
jgi:delta24-sterol reductase